MLWQRQKGEATEEGLTTEESAPVEESTARGIATGESVAERSKTEGSAAEGPFSFHPLSEIVEVPEEYELVMEAALGSHLQVLLNESGRGVLEAIDYLKGQKSGRSSFLSPKTSPHGGTNSYGETSRKSLGSEPGVKCFLSDVVSISETLSDAQGHSASNIHSQLVKDLLSSVVIVDSIPTALELRPRYLHHTFVTMEGDTLSADGVLTGGSREGSRVRPC